MRAWTLAIVCLLVRPPCASADVTSVTITSRTWWPTATYLATGPYEKLVGRIEFAIDPKDRQTRGLSTSPLLPAIPTDASTSPPTSWCSSRPIRPAATAYCCSRWRTVASRPCAVLQSRRWKHSPSSLEDFGDGLLMREGYTIVWVGWEFDAPATSCTSFRPQPFCRPPKKSRHSM